jgi:hypothetical protein
MKIAPRTATKRMLIRRTTPRSLPERHPRRTWEVNKDKATPINPSPSAEQISKASVFMAALSNRARCGMASTAGHCDKAALYGIFIPIISATGEARLQSGQQGGPHQLAM